MPKLCIILPNQLSLETSSLKHINPHEDFVLIAETIFDFTHVKHHKKKIVFILSAMRHFAEELQEKGYQVIYSRIEEKQKTLTHALQSTLKTHTIHEIIVTHPTDYNTLEELKSWPDKLGVLTSIIPDEHFLCTPAVFKDWAQNKKQLRMEFFYRVMRKKHNILMDKGQPAGGKWNYDAANRKKAPSNLQTPSIYGVKADHITAEVIEYVGKAFASHFGDIEPFVLAINRKQAKQALADFIQNRLCLFGDYQDAMLSNNPFMFHSHISFYLNCGMLSPLECLQAAEKAYHSGQAPLNAVEGFIRQILGWREFIRGIYWLKMPNYASLNYFNATRRLPAFYWTAETDMNCVKQSVTETKNNAYAHHIQRLMVLGNFALLAGIDPEDVNEWYLIVYADAYQWVELPNVSGMALFADGGMLASKPYAASGAYINKMSDYCKNCKFNIKEKTGKSACPFNYLYWDFIQRNRDQLSDNARMQLIFSAYDRMDPKQKQAIEKSSADFLHSIEQ